MFERSLRRGLFDTNDFFMTWMVSFGMGRVESKAISLDGELDLSICMVEGRVSWTNDRSFSRNCILRVKGRSS